MKTYVVDRLKLTNLGLQGEIHAREIAFDASSWQQRYGPGELQLLHCRSGDDVPYPVAVRREGARLIWPVSPVDTAFSGMGKAQLLYFVGDALVKSLCFETKVMPSLQEPCPAPAPHQHFLDAVAQQAALAQAAAAQVHTAAQQAQQAAAQTAQDRRAITQTGQQVQEAADKTSQTVTGLEQTADQLTRQAQESIRRTADDAIGQVEQTGASCQAAVSADKQAAQDAAHRASQKAADAENSTAQARQAYQQAESTLPPVRAAADRAATAAEQAEQQQQSARQAAQDAAEQADRAKTEADRSIALGLTQCQPGDTVQIKAVDDKGIPTAWQSARRYTLIEKGVTTQTAAFLRSLCPDNTPYRFSAIKLYMKTNACHGTINVFFDQGERGNWVNEFFWPANKHPSMEMVSELRHGSWNSRNAYANSLGADYRYSEHPRQRGVTAVNAALPIVQIRTSGELVPADTSYEIWAVKA